MAQYGLKISAHTSGQKYNRAAGVTEYLREHPEVKEFVRLDDCEFDFEDYRKLWERPLITNGIEGLLLLGAYNKTYQRTNRVLYFLKLATYCGFVFV